MANKKIGCAIIGYGGMGSWHANKILNELGEYATLIGVYDTNRAKHQLASQNNIYSYYYPEDLFRDPNVDLIIIAAPNDVHRDIAITALEADKNVVCEKPVALSANELEEILLVANYRNKLFTVHQNRRWDEDFLTIKKIFDANTLGNVFRIESRVHGSRGIPGDWRNQSNRGGGMLYDWGVHLLDQMLILTHPRKIKSVFSELTNITNENCDDGFRATILFDDGLSFYVEVATSNFIELPRWYMLGENGTAAINNWACDGKIVMVSDWENKDAVPIVAGAGITKTMAPRNEDSIKEYRLPIQKANWNEYYKNVFDCLNGKAEIIVTHSQQRRLMKLIEAVFASGSSNKTVIFPLGL